MASVLRACLKSHDFSGIKPVGGAGFVSSRYHKYPVIIATTSTGYEILSVRLGFAYLQPALPETLAKMRSRSKPVANAPS